MLVFTTKKQPFRFDKNYCFANKMSIIWIGESNNES